jgi:hypothetical protein
MWQHIQQLDSLPFNEIVQSLEQQRATLVRQATILVVVPRPMFQF